MSEERQRAFNEEIRRIFANGRLKPISWGADSDTKGWAVWSIDERLRYAMDLAAAMNQAAEIMQGERNELLEKLTVSEAQLKNADERVTIYKNTMTESITKANERQQADGRIIAELQARVTAQDALIEKLNGDLD